jgi:neurotransmitter:Na+ symporter, NSS family
MTQTHPQEQWSSRTAFILATIGAAVGLGNIWRFSYIAGENGGAAFLLVYLAFVLLIGLPLMIAELSLGRRGGQDAVTAFEVAAQSGLWRYAGWVGAAGAVLILSYYAVIAGWAAKYFFGAITGHLWIATEKGFGGYFDSFIAQPFEPVLWQAVMLAACALVVAGGVKSGIERINLWLMPFLALLVTALALFALSLPGSGRGVAFLLAPDWSAFSRPSVYLNALGQAFFSLGVGMAVFVAYGSYLDRGTRIPSSAAAIALGDTTFAIVAGLAIFPAVFALGGDPTAGPRLAFITFPQVLSQMPGGPWIGVVFFFLLSAAALTSMVSLMEVGVAVVTKRMGISRRTATILLTLAIFALGLPSALSYGSFADITLGGAQILDAIDHVVSNFLLPISGLLIALFVGWWQSAQTVQRDADFRAPVLGRVWIWLLRYVAPFAIAIILLRSVGLL